MNEKTVEKLKRLLEEAERLKVRGSWTFEEYQRISNQALALIQPHLTEAPLTGRFLEPFLRLAPREWRVRVAQENNPKTQAA